MGPVPFSLTGCSAELMGKLLVCPYSLEEALRFQWTSVTGALEADRLRVMEKFSSGRDVIDVGCAGGAYADYMEKLGYKAFRFDLSWELLDFCRGRRDGRRNACGDVLRLPFKKKVFDTALAFDVLEHVDDVSALQELGRVVRHRVIAAVPMEVDPLVVQCGLLYSHYQDTTHQRYYTPQTVRALFEKAGFDVIHLEETFPVDFLLAAWHLGRTKGWLYWPWLCFFALLRRVYRSKQMTALLVVGAPKK